jgi:hypothetical protein
MKDAESRALRAEAEVVALKAALRPLREGLPLLPDDLSGPTPVRTVSVVVTAREVYAVEAALSSSGSDLLDAVSKAREALRDLLPHARDWNHIEGKRIEAALAELSRFLPEGT